MSRGAYKRIHLSHEKNPEPICRHWFKIASGDHVTAFSLIELLVVLAVISLLIGIMVPALATSKAQVKQVVCQSNLRQLLLATTGYTGENDGHFFPAALDIYGDNRHRWYGGRDRNNEPFDTGKSLLAPYWGEKILECSEQVDYVNLDPDHSDYDQGSGGYGYNMIYVGSNIWAEGYEDESCRDTAKVTQIKRPAQTLLFTDSAMAKTGSYIEYSFSEPRYFVVNGEPVVDAGWVPSPSIHFRHRHQANIGWGDGHVSSEIRGGYDGINEDGSRPADMELGWFKPMDNTFFDLE